MPVFAAAIVVVVLISLALLIGVGRVISRPAITRPSHTS